MAHLYFVLCVCLVSLEGESVCRFCTQPCTHMLVMHAQKTHVQHVHTSTVVHLVLIYSPPQYRWELRKISKTQLSLPLHIAVSFNEHYQW